MVPRRLRYPVPHAPLSGGAAVHAGVDTDFACAPLYFGAVHRGLRVRPGKPYTGGGGDSLSGFLLPGLILLSIITGSYGNTSSSLFDAKRERYIDDVLISPITPFQMALAYVLGGVLRGMLVGAGTFALAVPLSGLPAEHPPMLLIAGVATSVAFASLGVVAGVLATRIDHVFFLSSIVIQPLTFLGGVFYSAEMLPAPLRAATYANPIFYAVDAFRFAAVGVYDTQPYPALAALLVFAVIAFLGTTELIRRGYKLRY